VLVNTKGKTQHINNSLLFKALLIRKHKDKPLTNGCTDQNMNLFGIMTSNGKRIVDMELNMHYKWTRLSRQLKYCI
jgi:hypothetical protein